MAPGGHAGAVGEEVAVEPEWNKRMNKEHRKQVTGGFERRKYSSIISTN